MNTHRKFAFVVDGEVAFAMRFTNEVPLHERMIAGLSSDPVIVEVPRTTQVLTTLEPNGFMLKESLFRHQIFPDVCLEGIQIQTWQHPSLGFGKTKLGTSQPGAIRI